MTKLIQSLWQVLCVFFQKSNLAQWQENTFFFLFISSLRTKWNIDKYVTNALSILALPITYEWIILIWQRRRNIFLCNEFVHNYSRCNCFSFPQKRLTLLTLSINRFCSCLLTVYKQNVTSSRHLPLIL